MGSDDPGAGGGIAHARDSVNYVEKTPCGGEWKPVTMFASASAAGELFEIRGTLTPAEVLQIGDLRLGPCRPHLQRFRWMHFDEAFSVGEVDATHNAAAAPGDAASPAVGLRSMALKSIWRTVPSRNTSPPLMGSTSAGRTSAGTSGLGRAAAAPSPEPRPPTTTWPAPPNAKGSRSDSRTRLNGDEQDSMYG